MVEVPEGFLTSRHHHIGAANLPWPCHHTHLGAATLAPPSQHRTNRHGKLTTGQPGVPTQHLTVTGKRMRGTSHLSWHCAACAQEVRPAHSFFPTMAHGGKMPECSLGGWPAW